MTQSPEEIIEELATHYRAIIELIGENPDREGLKKTPLRAAKALYYATGGYRENPKEIMRQAVFEHSGSKIVMVKGIEFYSFCEHHILPLFGKIAIAYIPDGEIIGLSKLARVVNTYARRLQVQERLTSEICKSISESLSTKGVMVMCNAEHLCMKMRGVEKQESSTVTTEYVGAFESDATLRQEFYQFINN